MASKENLVGVSNINFSLHVTVQSVEEKSYSYEIAENKGTYTRLLIALGNRDAEDFFHSQIFLVLNPKEDPAYPLLAKAKAGDRGIIKLSNSVKLSWRTNKQGEVTYAQETVLSVQDFQKEGDQ